MLLCKIVGIGDFKIFFKSKEYKGEFKINFYIDYLVKS